jgi:pyroglutamyl-peptidase
MPRVLVTGFEPYGNTPTNPAQGVAEALDGTTVLEAEVVGRVVPSLWFRCIEAAVAACEELRPDVLIMLGEFSGRAMVTVERIAQNLNDSSRYGIADNSGRVLQDEPTVPGGPAGIRATLPIRAMVLAMREEGIPADISDAPGTLMCNHMMYGVLHAIAERELPVRAGWVHLPALPSVAAREENLGEPSMTIETSATGLRAAIAAVLSHPKDVDAPVRSRLQI